MFEQIHASNLKPMVNLMPFNSQIVTIIKYNKEL